MSEQPRRRIVATITIGADSRDDLSSALSALAFDPPDTTSVSGGPHFGWVVDVNEDASVTHESYVEALDAWLAARVGAAGGDK